MPSAIEDPKSPHPVRHGRLSHGLRHLAQCSLSMDSEDLSAATAVLGDRNDTFAVRLDLCQPQCLTRNAFL